MRSLMVCLVASGMCLVGSTAMADSCQGDLYCDDPPRICEQEGGLRYYCSAGDVSVDETLLRR